MNLSKAPRLTALTFVVAQPLSAQDLFWNAGLTGDRRDGNWTSDPIWNSSANGDPSGNSLWDSAVSGDNPRVYFPQTEGGRITLGSDVTLDRISAGDGGLFEITSTSSSLRKASGLLFIDVLDSSAGELIISADIAADEIVKTGDGRLIFRGKSEGNLTLDRGEIVLSGNNFGGSTLIDTLPNTRTILEGDLTISELITNGTISGPGKLTATTYRLLDGSIVESDLGPGRVILGGEGMVEISGNLESGVLQVPGGTLKLAGGSLAALTQLSTSGSGVLDLQGDQTVGSYLQVGNGSLTGPGVLSPTFGALLRGGEVAASINGAIEVLDDTTLSGSATGPLTTVRNGKLLVTGSLRSDEIDILSAVTIAELGQLGSSSKVSNSGTLQVDTDALVSHYTQNTGGRLSGIGVLRAGDAALLDGGLIEGNLIAPATVTGNLSVTGSLGGTLLSVESGQTMVSGTLASESVQIQPGSRLLLAGNFDQVGQLINESLLVVDTNGTITQYIQRDSSSLQGMGILSATRATLEGGLIEGHLRSDITVTDDLLVPGIISGESLAITNGTTRATGRIESALINLTGATLISGNGSLSPSSRLELDEGSLLRLFGDQSIQSLNSSGTLEGPGSLSLNSANLLEGSRIALPLRGLVVSSGNVTIEPAGSISGPLLNVTTGTVIARGPLDSSEILIGPSAELIDDSTGTFSGNSTLENRGRISLSGRETLAGLVNRNGGELIFSIMSPEERDYLKLGPAGLSLDEGSILVIDEAGLEPGETTRIIEGGINGSFDRVETSENAHSNLRFTFDPSQGTLQSLPGVIVTRNREDRLYNLTRNQTQIFGNAFDQVNLDPADGGSNFRRLFFRETPNSGGSTTWLPVSPDDRRPGDVSILDLDPGRGRATEPTDRQGTLLGEAVTSVQSAFQSAQTDDGHPATDLNGNPIAEISKDGIALLNQISPDSYASFGQVTGEVLRTQMRRLSQHQPVFGSDLFAVTTDLQFANGGSSLFPSGGPSDWDFTSFSFALHRQWNESLNLGLLLGANDGAIDYGSRNFDSSGKTIGLFGTYQFSDRFQTLAFFNLGLGDQEFDGSRPGFGGDVHVNGVDAGATEISFGANSLIWDHDNIALRPRVSMRYLRTKVNSFKEQGPGLALEIDDFKNDSFLLEAGIDAEFRLNDTSSLQFGLGLVHDFASRNQNLTSRFSGGNPFSIDTRSPNVSAVILTSGASFELRENLHLSVNLRGEFRENAPNFQLFSVGGLVTF